MMVAMVLLPASCIEDNMDKSATGEGMVPINLTISPKAVSTRTATTDIQSAQLASGQTFYAYFTSADVVPQSTTFTTDGAGGTTPASQPYFKLSETSTGVRAYYPSSVTEETTSFTVEANQSGDDAYRASDLMFASANITKVFPASTGALTFAHKMAKIKVTTTTRVSSIKTIKLKGILPTVPFNASDGTLGTASGSATDITMYSHSGQTANINCVALIPPQSKAADATLIEVTSALHSSTPLTYKLPNAITFQSGLQYIFNVDLHEEQLVVTCTVSPWSSTTTSSAEVSVMQPPVVGDYFYADGTWSTDRIIDKTVIGLVFCITPTSDDIARGYTHGYVLALKDYAESNDTKWANNTSNVNGIMDEYHISKAGQFGNNAENSVLSSPASIDLNGLTNTLKIAAKASGKSYANTNLSDITNTYPAAYKAVNYASSANGSVAPANTSGWYLPSIGQQYLWLWYFGNWKTVPTVFRPEANDCYWDNIAHNCGSAMNNYFNTKFNNQSSLFSAWDQSHSGKTYWSSTVITSGGAVYALNFADSDDLLLYYQICTFSYRVRPVLAF